MKVSKKRFTTFIIVFSIITFLSGIKIGEVLANKMLDKPSNEELGTKEVEEKKEKEVEEKKEKEVLEKKKEESNKDNLKVKENIDKSAKTEKPETSKEESTAKEEEAKKPEEKTEDKVAYLTFDDGPSRNVTPQILDILRKYDVKATFFVTGRAVENNKDIVSRAYSEGHTIGNHSYSHNYKYLYSNVNNFLADMKKNEELLRKILGPEFKFKLVRLPGGSYGEKKVPYNNAIKNKGYKSIDWNALTGDAEGHHVPKDRLVQKLKITSQGKNEIIVLMHDLGTKETTVSALPEVIEYLKSEGYEFRVLN